MRRVAPHRVTQARSSSLALCCAAALTSSVMLPLVATAPPTPSVAAIAAAAQPISAVLTPLLLWLSLLWRYQYLS